MIYQERLFKILQFPYISEKASVILQKNNVVVFKVTKYATKLDIKNAVSMCFSVKVHRVNVVTTAKKIKGSSSKKIGCCSSWKKAYVMLERGQKIDFLKKSE